MKKLDHEITASFSEVTLSKDLPNHNKKTILSTFPKFMKRLFDLSFTLVLLILVSPFLIIIPVAVKLSSRGPVLEREWRVGLHGKKFAFLKFRTRYPDTRTEARRNQVENLIYDDEADQADVMEEYLNYLEERITPFGKLLIMSGLDALPQLLNILAGDLSIVGPRPHLVHEVESYKNWYRRRLSIKPGLIGWTRMNLQTPPRNYEESILYDLWYVDNWHFFLDMRILFRAIPYVLFN